MAVISNKKLFELLTLIAEIPGDFAEIGVFRGDTFKRLSQIGHATGRHSHGFDSFVGMAPSTEKDAGHYPEGKLSVGGIDNFILTMDEAAAPRSSYTLYEGFIPVCLEMYSSEKPLAFSLVDVDQYEPTLTALNWIWPHVAYGGILVTDDYFPGRSILASAAIDRWLATINPTNVEILGCVDTQLILRKTPTSAIGMNYAPKLHRDH